MARRFNGTTNQIKTSAGTTNITNGPATMAAVVRSLANLVRGRIATFGDVGTNFSLDKSATDVIEWTDTPAATLNIKTADGWIFVAVTKATGTVAPRFHKYVYSTGVWSHEDGGTTVANLTATGSVYLGTSAATSLFWNGDIAMVGLWNVVLTDSQIESLPDDLSPQNWDGYTKARGLWIPEPSPAVSLIDRSGGGAIQSSITGTTATPDEMPLLAPGAWPGGRVVSG